MSKQTLMVAMVKRFALIVGVAMCLGFASVGKVAAEITLVGPSSRSLPADLELTSPDTHMIVGRFAWCFTGGVFGSAPPLICEPYFISRTGPDTDGLYHYFWRLSTAASGEVHLDAETWSDGSAYANRERVTFTATTSGIAFGDIQTCLMPGTRSRVDGLVSFELTYFSQKGSTATVLEQKKTGGEWTAPRLRARANFPVGPPRGFAPYTRRTIRLRVKRSDLSDRRLRLLYYVQKGNRYSPRGNRIPKLTAFSTQSCPPASGI